MELGIDSMASDPMYKIMDLRKKQQVLQREFLKYLDNKIIEYNEKSEDSTFPDEHLKYLDMKNAFEEVREKFEDIQMGISNGN